MSKFNDLLHLRFKQKEPQQEKMIALVERANKGNLSSFSGVFRVAELNEKEKEDLENILRSFQTAETGNVDEDFKALKTITSEVKAITNQAVILHGERIKKAQEILKNYREGAFTAWLFSTYGNRQTPYNFLQYYEFYTLLPQSLHAKLDQMPRQAVYSLASRSGSIELKEEIVKNYVGQAKEELLKLIRHQFPLPEDDKRLPLFGHNAIQYLKKAREQLKNRHCSLKEDEKGKLQLLIEEITRLIGK
ncbi:MAG: hypothetical protein A3D96_00685 [Chlamydiae bacterium RIFCSPHIGHO2_12_FULL_44_59]|nr:MAG: hypothetical protein A2796_00130 [Chlamydiae bacterium RIFCSPHIGHO2_01_FULL_44_39]OGN59368.1 MAG: hypothetical protein A3C42_02290 [Chlamydiae bacterium RIFCSPHIGHO2_02_FULL_45_9]OGN59963.1 MAG: hypothetical protein A3D96_00685 [Chlamydiae bacterium RIFCSPHIGHO2_12_FULL_44_59]OGN66178.1 MAG: hypothetical protein A2978_06010 [Chlamydiae bacterium RIFCSPLOWO2_01_FULL_44_52]OGN69082.1 MAG: hypothetical protein A3I67_07495 [Chlamydiae bacterium RIFCSPLOWO2_02_FULL_45_22]OGN69921.1 MAG: hyp